MGMIGTILDIHIKQGKTFCETLFLVYENGTNEVPYDLTPVTDIMAQIRDKTGNLLVDLTEKNGKIIVDRRAGKIILKISPTETESLPPQTNAEWELEMIYENGEIKSPVRGNCYIEKEIVKY